MGRKALAVGYPSRAAAIVFDRHREENGLTVNAVFKQGGWKARERHSNLLKGVGEWTLEDVAQFAKFFKISLRRAFLEIEHETALLLASKEFPYQLEDEIAS